MAARPSFIVSTRDVSEVRGSYPDRDEAMGYGRAIGAAAGLLRIGLHVERLPPGQRTSYPHAKESEEEFVFVLEGEVDAWIDGHVHRMRAGDLAAFPAGTGICHTFINDGDREALLLVGGEKSRPEHRVFYPLNPERAAQMKPGVFWIDPPAQPRGAHDGLPIEERLRRVTETEPLT